MLKCLTVQGHVVYIGRVECLGLSVAVLGPLCGFGRMVYIVKVVFDGICSGMNVRGCISDDVVKVGRGRGSIMFDKGGFTAIEILVRDIFQRQKVYLGEW